MQKIKNLKIYKSKLLNKMKFTLASLGVMSSILVGCGSNKLDDNKIPATPATYTVEYDTPELLSEVEVLDDVDNYDATLAKEVLDKLDTKISLSSETRDEIKEYISGINVDYQYSDLYGVDDVLSRYNEIGKTYENHNLEIIKNNKVDSDVLYKTVLENNKIIPNKAMIIKDSKIKEIVEIISDQINKKLDSTNDISYSNLEYTLKNLRIFDYKNFGTAYVDLEQPILYLNFITIDNLQEVSPETNVFDVTIRHEADHLMQVRYSKDGSFETNLGICYSFSDVDINSINWKWFYEGSAEKLTLEKDETPYVYFGEVRAIETLTMATILDDNVDENDIEELSLQHSLDKLFDKFGAKTLDEKKEIINMMFSYDLALNNTEEFSKVYEEKYNKKFNTEDKENFRYNVLSNVGQTLTKTFYSNLTDCIFNNNMSVEEVFSLMSLYESKMNTVIRFDESTYQNEKINFIETYSDIQLKFFEKLAENINMDPVQLRSLYCTYHNDYNKKYNYDFLSEGEQGFINEMVNDSVYGKTVSIISKK